MKWLLLIFCLLPAPAFAEDTKSNDVWSSDPAKEHPGISAENRIIRWCADEGALERFASANIEIKGYHPCGELKMPIACDPSGRRMIGSTAETQYAFKDCAVKRIIMPEKTAFENFQDPPADGTSNPDPLTSKERSALAGEIVRAKKDQANNLDMQMQQALQGVLQNLLTYQGYDPVTGQKQARVRRVVPSKQRRFSDQQIDEMIRYVDPQYQPKLERLLRTQ